MAFYISAAPEHVTIERKLRSKCKQIIQERMESPNQYYFKLVPFEGENKVVSTT